MQPLNERLARLETALGGCIEKQGTCWMQVRSMRLGMKRTRKGWGRMHAYFAVYDKYPIDGEQIYSSCGKTHCVNPLHMEILTASEHRKRTRKHAREKITHDEYKFMVDEQHRLEMLNAVEEADRLYKQSLHHNRRCAE